LPASCVAILSSQIGAQCVIRCRGWRLAVITAQYRT
jgi:hypothetical protein